MWFRIVGLPLEYYNHRFLWKVVARVGFLLKVDNSTSITSRGKFAKICIEVALRSLLSKIWFKTIVVCHTS